MKILVPASSANLGPGFDCFGIAWQLYDELEFIPGGDGLHITGCDEKYCNTENLAYRAYAAVLERCHLAPEPLTINFLKCDIPICRGLGSSSALLVGGVLAANAIHNLNMSREDLLSVATALEGHPDNVAPALFGGLTASAVEAGIPLSVSYPLSDKLYFTALVPPFELSTALSRGVLPHQVDRADAIFNVSRAALLIGALGSGDVRLLRAAMADRLHEPYRIPLIEGFDTARGLAYKCGAEAMCISGAGSTLLCVSTDPNFTDKIANDLSAALPGWRALPMHCETRGAHVVED
jgi:homoserine kinase